jgi:DNA-binding response OmpR family regulator
MAHDAAPHALVAHGDADLRARLGRALGAAGWRVSEIADGGALRECVVDASLAEGPALADLIVSDAALRGASGLTILAMRSLGARTPLVLLAGACERGERVAAARLGATVLEEPLEREALASAVVAAADRAKAQFQEAARRAW